MRGSFILSVQEEANLVVSQKCSRRNFLISEIWLDPVTVSNPVIVLEGPEHSARKT